jgi:hypothetical protein
VGECAAEGGDLQRFGTDHHMHDLEAAADDAGAAEGVADLLRRRVGGDIEILRLLADQQVAHGAADHVGLEAFFLKGFAGAPGGAGEVFAPDAMWQCVKSRP